MSEMPLGAAIVHASYLSPSTLTTKPLSELCPDFITGFCRRGYHCPRDHEICAIENARPPLRRVLCSPNLLSLYPRTLPPSQTPFDDDGPGTLSSLGSRHDNDHVDIQDIRILPTTDEMLCLRPPFIPRKSLNANHHLPRGQKRHLDTLFRQLRYDSTEAIIDACYHASQFLTGLGGYPPIEIYDDRQITPRKVRYSLFHDISFEDIIFSPSKGLMMRVSFACPKGLRGKRMTASKRLEEGMLVALIGLDGDGKLSTTFMEIDQRQSTESMRSRTGNDSRGMYLII